MRSASALRLLAAGLACLFLASGCMAVKPWERDALARQDMQWEPDPLEAELRGHVRFSKEGGMVGGGAGGGGCGCN